MGRAWFRSRWVRFGGAAVGLLVLATVAAPFLIPMDRYRQLLVAAMETATGRQVRIDALSINVLPKLRLHMTGFRVENPAGFPAGDALVARSVDLGIALRPLLARHVHITYIAPAGVQINVLRNAAGRTNIAVAPRTGGAQPSATGPLTLERIGVIDVKDAAAALADASDPRHALYELTGVSAKIRSIDPQATDWLKKLTVTADLNGARLATSLLTKPLLFRTGSFSFENGAGRGSFSLTLDTVSLTGSAAFARVDPLSITFAVSAPAVDLEALAALLRPGSATGLAATASRGLLASGTVSIGKVAFAPFETTKNTAHVELYPSTVRLDRYAFSAYGGTVHGSAAFEGSGNGVQTSATAQAGGINVEQALEALGYGTRKVTGTAQADLHFNTTLAHGPEQALTAAGTFAVRNGTFPSLDVKGKLANVARLVNLNVPSGETSFSSFGGDLQIAHERASSNDLRLVANDLQATIRGSFGFDQTLNYSGTGIVDTLAPGTSTASSTLVASARSLLNDVVQRALGATRVKIPFSLHGTLANPQFSLAGTPQIVTTQSPAQTSAPAVPSVRDLLKSIPGLPQLPL